MRYRAVSGPESPRLSPRPLRARARGRDIFGLRDNKAYRSVSTARGPEFSPAPPVMQRASSPYPMAFNAFACWRNAFDSSRSMSRVPPLSGFLATFALPSGDFGPVDFSQGFHCWINSARSLRCSGVR
jgi:hypothetical protein